jgi:hypothetical protein
MSTALPTALDRLVNPDGRLTLGLELPLDNDWSATRLRAEGTAGRPFGVPDLTEHARLARLADELGFAALWVRDVPLYDPQQFGDAGSVFEVFTHLGHLAAVTERAVLGTAAVVLPLRRPLLVAKAAATVDVLSGGRFVLGLASGDRPVEYPLFGEGLPGPRRRLPPERRHPPRRLDHPPARAGHEPAASGPAQRPRTLQTPAADRLTGDEPRPGISSSTSRKLSGKPKCSHTQHAMISTGYRCSLHDGDAHDTSELLHRDQPEDHPTPVSQREVPLPQVGGCAAHGHRAARPADGRPGLPDAHRVPGSRQRSPRRDARHALSPHRTPLLDGQTLPATALDSPSQGSSRVSQVRPFIDERLVRCH